MSKYLPSGIQMGVSAERVEDARISQAGESPRFNAFDLAPATDILEGAYAFSEELPPDNRRGVVWRAVVLAAEAGVVSGKTLEGALVRAQREWLAGGTSRWSILTRLSTPWLPEMRTVRAGKAAVHFYQGRPRRYDTSEIERRAKEVTVEGPNPLSVWVRVAIEARGEYEAFRSGSDALDLVRGLWNFRLNSLKGPSIMAAGVQRPLNPFRPGPTYTLHDGSGALAPIASLWWESRDRQHWPIWNRQYPWSNLVALAQKDRRYLNRSRYRDRLAQLIVRYTRALDSNDWDIVIVRLWSVLEALTDSDKKSGGPTIERTMALLRNAPEMDKQLLTVLKETRNGIVHHDLVTADPYKLVTRLKFYVEVLLNFHLRMGYEFRDFEEAVAFLSLGTNRKALQRRKELIERFLELD